MAKEKIFLKYLSLSIKSLCFGDFTNYVHINLSNCPMYHMANNRLITIVQIDKAT